MTESERQIARALVDRARRARLAQERIRDLHASRRIYPGPRIVGRCDYCGGALPDAKPTNRSRLRFCSSTHRANFRRVGRGRLDYEQELARLFAQEVASAEQAA